MDLGDNGEHPASGKVRLMKVSDQASSNKRLSVKEMMSKVADMEKEMFGFARDLEFEKAASMRDEGDALRKEMVRLS
jgi:excinuclease ABC subunit B